MGGHILIADDNAINRELVRTLLEPSGFTFEEVENGVQALRRVAIQPFALILMDVHMPIMDGLTAAEVIRSTFGLNQRTPILALTANVLPAQVEACHAAGMDDHIAKPISTRNLLEKVAHWVDQPRV